MTASAQPKPSIRDYDPSRMQRLAFAMWEGMLLRARDESGVLYLSTIEVLDAMAMLGGIVLSTSPVAQVPSRLREVCQDHGKSLARWTRTAAENPESLALFDAVLTDDDKIN